MNLGNPTVPILFSELKPHLDELKMLFLKVFVVFVSLFFVNFFIAGIILEWLAGNYQVISIKPYDSFNALFVVDLALTIAMVFPLVILSLTQYISPAIQNTKNIKHFVFASITLFYLGLGFGVLVFSSIILQYFTDLSLSMGIANQWGVTYLISFIFSNSIIFGFIFQLPLLVFLGIYYEVVDVKKITKNSVFAVPVVLLGSAWFTPPDLLSMLLMAVPILGLFYASVFVSILVKKRRR